MNNNIFSQLNNSNSKIWKDISIISKIQNNYFLTEDQKLALDNFKNNFNHRNSFKNRVMIWKLIAHELKICWSIFSKNKYINIKINNKDFEVYEYGFRTVLLTHYLNNKIVSFKNKNQTYKIPSFKFLSILFGVSKEYIWEFINKQIAKGNYKKFKVNKETNDHFFNISLELNQKENIQEAKYISEAFKLRNFSLKINLATLIHFKKIINNINSINKIQNHIYSLNLENLKKEIDNYYYLSKLNLTIKEVERHQLDLKNYLINELICSKSKGKQCLEHYIIEKNPKTNNLIFARTRCRFN